MRNCLSLLFGRFVVGNPFGAFGLCTGDPVFRHGGLLIESYSLITYMDQDLSYVV